MDWRVEWLSGKEENHEPVMHGMGCVFCMNNCCRRIENGKESHVGSIDGGPCKCGLMNFEPHEKGKA